MNQHEVTGRHRDLEVVETRFEISTHYDEGELKVDLTGTFDALSAERLIKCLQDHRKHIKRAVIHTGRLNRLDPVGKDTFQGGLHELKDLCYYLVFCGKHAGEISPPWTFSY
jgi:hypothetical protein